MQRHDNTDSATQCGSLALNLRHRSPPQLDRNIENVPAVATPRLSHVPLPPSRHGSPASPFTPLSPPVTQPPRMAKRKRVVAKRPRREYRSERSSVEASEVLSDTPTARLQPPTLSTTPANNSDHARSDSPLTDNAATTSLTRRATQEPVVGDRAPQQPLPYHVALANEAFLRVIASAGEPVRRGNSPDPHDLRCQAMINNGNTLGLYLPLPTPVPSPPTTEQPQPPLPSPVSPLLPSKCSRKRKLPPTPEEPSTHRAKAARCG